MKNGLHIDIYGSKNYYLNDMLHREDGPAFENKYGHKEWWINDELHREDGPAVEYPDGDKDYHLNNIEYSEQNYWKELKRRKSLSYILSNIKKDKII
jgi:hypothetical protein